MKKTVAFILLLVPLLATWQAPVLADVPFSCNESQVSCEAPFVESDNFRQETEDQESWDDLLGHSEIRVFLNAWRTTWLNLQHDRNTDGTFSSQIIRAPPLH